MASRPKPMQPGKSITLRSLPSSYLHLSLQYVPTASTRAAAHQLDAITARTYFTSALSQFLGLTGTAIPIDILKLSGDDVWIRVPKEDASAVTAAFAQWANVSAGVSWKVKVRGDWLGAVVAAGQLQKEQIFFLAT